MANMIRTAELLADLTLLKTIGSTEALTLVAAPPSESDGTDKDFARAMEFLKLRATSNGKAYAELEEKRRAVAKTLRWVTGEVEGEEEKGDGREGSASPDVKIVGAWGR